ncbi:MAG TPA: reverse transcriptase family protein [Armatimonadota bacterium]|nr:reverse transcriptase family protein [Armatimonadota bacterium]
MLTALVIGLIILAIVILQRRAAHHGRTTARSPRTSTVRQTSDTVRLQRYGLPELHTEADLAAAMHISLKQLHWLCDFRHPARDSGVSSHYILRRIPKSGGGERILLAPKRQLKTMQRWILREMLDKVPPHEAAHGFRQGRSILSNASPHAGKPVVACFDLQDFFPSIRFPRVRGLFCSLGYSDEVARALAGLCTTYYLGSKKRMLPQGAPTSPAISNLIARRLDIRLSRLAQALGFTYTRYADDCTMSGEGTSLGALIRTVKRIMRDERFRVNERKLRIHRQGACHSVTGIVVNATPTISRAERRRLRAILHQAQFTGLAAQNRSGHEHFVESVRGKIAFLHMINPGHARPLEEALVRVTQNESVTALPPATASADADALAGYTAGPDIVGR